MHPKYKTAKRPAYFARKSWQEVPIFKDTIAKSFSRFSLCVAGGGDPTRTFADFSESDTSPPRSFPTMLPPWLGALPSKLSWKGGGPLSLTRMQWRSRGFRDRSETPPDPPEATGEPELWWTDFAFPPRGILPGDVFSPPTSSCWDHCGSCHRGLRGGWILAPKFKRYCHLVL
jgi:hypothetical protein